MKFDTHNMSGHTVVQHSNKRECGEIIPSFGDERPRHIKFKPSDRCTLDADDLRAIANKMDEIGGVIMFEWGFAKIRWWFRGASKSFMRIFGGE